MLGVVGSRTGAAARVCAFPLLFNVFFAAVLHIALERFSRNADILGDLVHLDESPEGMGP